MREKYTPEMRAYNRVRLLKRAARTIGFRLILPHNYKPEDIDNAASELSALIESESGIEA